MSFDKSWQFQKGNSLGKMFKIGHTPWNKGKPMLYKHGMLGKKMPKEAIEKTRLFNLGKKHSEETKRKKSITALSMRDVMRKNGLKGLLSQQNSKEPTSIEKIIYQKLKDFGIIYESQYVVGNRFIVDAFLPDHNIIIEVDGSYWHSLDRVRNKDKAENAYLKKCGYRVIRIPEKEVSNFSTASLFSEITAEKGR